MVRRRTEARAKARPTTATAPAKRAKIYTLIPRHVEEQMRQIRIWALKQAAQGQCRHNLLLYIALRAAAHGLPPRRTQDALLHWAREVSKLKPRSIEPDEVARAISWAYARPAGRIDTAIIHELHERMSNAK